MVSAEWSWQLAQDLFNPKIGFAPSANLDFFAQISLSTCTWVFRPHISLLLGAIVLIGMKYEL